MARSIHQRSRIKGILHATSAIHIGGINGTGTTDLELAIDGQGRYYIPGTSLAGAFRGWMELTYGLEATNAIWGYQVKDKVKDKGHASFLIIEDAVLLDANNQKAIVEVREGVGIDRQTGAAAEGIKYDRAILAKGTQFPLAMTLDIPAEAPDSLAQLHSLLDALCAGQIPLGAAKSRGLGRVKLQNCQYLTQSLNTPEGILDTLRQQVSNQGFTAYSPQPARHLPYLDIQIHWKPVGPLMVKALEEGQAVDILPLVSHTNANNDQANQLALVLPGSSIKGALRTQAERILRTVLGRSVFQSDNKRQQFLDQVRLPLAKSLFGSANTSVSDDPQSTLLEQRTGLGLLTVDDCHSQATIAPPQWQAVTTSKDEKQLRQALNDAQLQTTQQAMHVAIDRWTGGAAESMLYSAIEPFGVTWEPIGMHLNLGRFLETSFLEEERKSPKLTDHITELNQERQAAIALLLLVLRDLAGDRIPLGYGVNRGYGALQVDKVVLTGSQIPEMGLTDSATETTSLTLTFGPHGSIQGLTPDQLQQLTTAWQSWINTHQSIPEEAAA